MKTTAVLLAFLAMTASAEASWRCAFNQRQQCDVDGCRQVLPTTHAIVNPAAKSYSRCDQKGCDTYPAEFKESGQFINIDLPGRGMIAKVTRDGSSISEVATIGHTAFLSFGICSPQ